MTPAERALLLAVAKHAMKQSYCPNNKHIGDIINAVEAEAAPEEPANAKSCETCRFSDGEECTAGDGVCIPTSMHLWKPKPAEGAACQTCGGTGRQPWAKSPCGNETYKCHDCGGTGKKEKK